MLAGVLTLVSLDRYVKLTEDQRNQIKLLEQEHVATCHGHWLAAHGTVAMLLRSHTDRVETR